MHVGMKKAVAKDLRKENLDACSAQLAGIDTGRFQSFGLADRDAAHALHGEHRGRAVLPYDLRHHQQMPAPLRRRKVTPQLTAIGCLTDQIELVMQVVIELGHDLRSEEHTSELQSLMRTSYAVFCLK